MFKYSHFLIGLFSMCLATECPNLSGVNFGPCMMIIGWGWNGSDCEQFSGCGSIDFEGNDYSNNLYWNYDECINTCPCIEGYVECFVNPCEMIDCLAYPNAYCIPDYCGGCNANFYLNNILITDQCLEQEDCLSSFEGSGDINQDETINIIDIVISVNIIISGFQATEQELCILDLNQDAMLNVLDIILLINIILIS